jgi:hypothetical protein
MFLINISVNFGFSYNILGKRLLQYYKYVQIQNLIKNVKSIQIKNCEVKYFRISKLYEIFYKK